MADAEFADAGRASLLDKVFTLLTLDSPLLAGKLPVFTWAFLWLCDLRNLREIVDSLSFSADSERVEMLKRVLTNPYALREEVLKPWLLKRRRGTESYPTTPLGETPPRQSKKRKIDSTTPQTPTDSSHHPTASSPTTSSPIIPRPSRDPTLADPALQRDKACVIKATPDKAVLKTAHIYPFSMVSDLNKDRERLWSYLRIFWPADQVNAWKDTLLTPAKTEILENVITMTSDVHDAWDACLFALKPIKLSEDRKKLEIQFFWLEQGIFKSDAVLDKSMFLTEPRFRSTLQESSRGLRFYHNFTGARILSGFNFNLETHDPDNFPLPSFELLNMQWHLTRLAAMMGGAGFRDELLDDSSDGPDDWPMLASSSEESAIFSSGQLKRRWVETDDESVSDESVHGKLDGVVRESDATVDEGI